MPEGEFDDIICQYCNPQLIKQGGQRVVYKINHPRYGEAVLKIGKYSTPTSDEGWEFERINREIEILRNIDSQYYPKNYDFQKTTKNRYFILEEFVESLPLTDCMEKFHTPLTALELTKNLVIGLQIIWNKKIVHRDLKPDNILITKTGVPKIIDLGIARILDHDSITNSLYGGPLSKFYAAPEQHRYNKKLIGWRTDQYNLGILLIQLLSNGQHPFDPILVGGISIPDNIVNNNWNKRVFEDANLSSIYPLASKMIAHHQFQRYGKCEDLLTDIKSCIEVVK